ncbi:hypothetical protein [Pseudomonas sp. RIT-PI-q]|uniref:hypothetical protein n=1 Tax=Pseudomonas sp. RIT-PI-q TaxID=1690247 RepID=UPI00128F78C1|nr:hypothetical protein [Pseudomonas sp. RIT-PI-q]
MEKSRQIYCRWKRLGRTLTNESRTGTEQNVAFVKLNGAQDINLACFWAGFAPEQGLTVLVLHHQLHRYRRQASSHRFVDVHTFQAKLNTCGSWLACDEFTSVLQKKEQKKRSPKAPFLCNQPEIRPVFCAVPGAAG